MRRASVLLLTAGLAVGGAVGYIATRTVFHAATTTVVEVRTVAPPRPATIHLLVTISDSRGGCLPPGDGYTGALYRPTDTFVLRSDSGRLLAIADSDQLNQCSIILRYSFNPSIGLFYIVDNTTLQTEEDAWGPFNPHKLSQYDDHLQLP